MNCLNVYFILQNKMFSHQMIEILDNNPVIYNKNTTYICWLILYFIICIYPYQMIWYVPYLLYISYCLLTIITINIIYNSL